MDSQTRQQNLNNISDEDQAILDAYRAKTKSAYPVDDYWLVTAEFVECYGWQAYRDFKNDNIGLEEMMTLIEAKRKIDARKSFDLAQSVFIGCLSANSEKPASTFNRLTKQLLRQTEVDE